MSCYAAGVNSQPSPAFYFASQAPLLQLVAAPNSTITATLNDLGGVDNVTWQVQYVDDITYDALSGNPASYALTISGPKNSVCQLTTQGLGTCGLLTATVNGSPFHGFNKVTNAIDPALTANTMWVVLAANGAQVGFPNEQFQSGGVGWTRKFNAAVRGSISSNGVVPLQATATTTDAAITTLTSIPIPAGGLQWCELTVNAALLGTWPNLAPSTFRRVFQTVQNAAGYVYVATEDSLGSLLVQPVFVDGSQASPGFNVPLYGSCFLTLSGSNLLIQVQGHPAPQAWQAAHTYVSSVLVSGAGNAGGLVKLTCVAHGMTTGQQGSVSGVTGTTEANGDWTFTVVDVDHVTLNGSVFANGYLGSGTLTLSPFVTNAGNVYVMTQAGVSAGAGGPVGGTANEVDNTVRWARIGPTASGIPIRWTAYLTIKPG